MPNPALLDSFSVQDVYAGWVEALRELGETVIEFNLDARLTFYGHVLLEQPGGEVRKALTGEKATELAANGLFSTLYKARPDVLLIISGFFVPPEIYNLCRAYGTKTVVIHTESPYETSRELAIAPFADLNLLTDPTAIAAFPEKSTYYLPHSYRPSVHSPGPPTAELVCDLGFVGTGFPSRVGFFERMDLAGLDVLLAGNWQDLPEGSPLTPYLSNEKDLCLDNADAVDLYRSARVGINLYRRESESAHTSHGVAISPREIEMAACQMFFLRDQRGEGDEVLDMLPTFASPEDASEQLRWWLAHDDERGSLARKARDAIADRTFENHAKSLLRLLEKQG